MPIIRSMSLWLTHAPTLCQSAVSQSPISASRLPLPARLPMVRAPWAGYISGQPICRFHKVGIRFVGVLMIRAVPCGVSSRPLMSGHSHLEDTAWGRSCGKCVLEAYVGSGADDPAPGAVLVPRAKSSKILASLGRSRDLVRTYNWACNLTYSLPNWPIVLSPITNRLISPVVRSHYVP